MDSTDSSSVAVNGLGRRKGWAFEAPLSLRRSEETTRLVRLRKDGKIRKCVSVISMKKKNAEK